MANQVTYGVPLIVGNPAPSPTRLRPIEHGTDIVVHAATKYIGGHGTPVGGVPVDSDRFPWLDQGQRFRLLTKPDLSYHGVNHAKDVGSRKAIRMRQPITGYHRDEEQHWVAELACGHCQHVRHNPPWVERLWVTSVTGRNAMLGFELNCAKCDQGAPRDS